MGYRKLVVGTDGSVTATAARDAAIRLAKRFRAVLHVVCAYEPPRMNRQLAEDVIRRSLDAASRQKVESSGEIGQGDPADVLCQVAETADIDLIVVGNKGMSGARRFLLGSVPNQVAHYAPTDVLIAKTVDRTVDDLAPGHGGVIDLEGE